MPSTLDRYAVYHEDDPDSILYIIKDTGSVTGMFGDVFSYYKNFAKQISTGGRIIKENSSPTKYEIVYAREGVRVFVKYYLIQNVVYGAQLFISDSRVNNTIEKSFISTYESFNSVTNVSPTPTPKPTPKPTP